MFIFRGVPTPKMQFLMGLVPGLHMKGRPGLSQRNALPGWGFTIA